MNKKITIICFLLFSFFFIACNKNDSQPSDNLKQRELELKEKELQLKEKELLDKKESDIEMQRKELEREKERLKENKNQVENYNKRNYISEGNGVYTQASQRLLTSSDLYGMTPYQLKIMRNEIFARHGYIFKTDDMKRYFNGQAWYNPRYNNVDNFLSSIEKKNIALIMRYE
jgi:hypothetical protein